LITVALSACQSKAVRPTAPPSTAVAVPDTTGATRYRIDSVASEVHILVFRGGAMARLGHNHVVSSKDVSGTLWLQDDLAHSRIELSLPVATFSVDDPQARSKEGEDFAAEVPRDAREGTKRNLLRGEVLDAEHYPKISLRSVKIGGTRQAPELSMRINIRGVERDVLVPATVREDGGRLTASGEFAIKQTDFGITPFTVALGALQVLDQLRIKFSVVCVKEQ
jgi:polyisoprenoid-binding protein YceI